MVLGLVFEKPATVAMTAGVAVGIIGAAAFAYSTKDGAAASGPIRLISWVVLSTAAGSEAENPPDSTVQIWRATSL